MSYGLDMSEVRYEVDESGKRMRAIIPLTMFSALTAFWVEARRAQTAQLEARARPGMYRGSLGSVPSEPQAAQEPTSNTEPATAPPPAAEGKYGRKWATLIAQMPAEPEPANEANAGPAHAATAADTSPTQAPTINNEIRTRGTLTRQVFFAREFEEAPPADVMEQVRRGVYFLRAWRDYRRLTREDVAELFGKTPDAINWHENGYSRPREQTLARFAEILDCPVAQLTAKAGSNTRPWLTVIEGDGNASKDKARTNAARRAPDDTDYPDAVLAHMIAGKTPLTAWRLHRHLTIAALAEQYGCSAKNIRDLEESATLRPATIAKLCPILHCKPDQLLRPESMEAPAAPLRVRHASADIQMERRKRATGEARMA